MWKPSIRTDLIKPNLLNIGRFETALAVCVILPVCMCVFVLGGFIYRICEIKGETMDLRILCFSLCDTSKPASVREGTDKNTVGILLSKCES